MARLRVAVLGAVASGALAVGVACSSSETAPTPSTSQDAAPETATLEPVEPADAAPPACKLVIGSTGVPACDECLQKSCCVVINTCFADKECEILNNCINQCGMTLGLTDAGSQCARQCGLDHPDAATKVVDSKECESTRCDTECK